MTKYRYFVVGDEDTVLGFQCAGVAGAVVNTSQEAAEALRRVREGGVGVVIVTEEVADMVRAEMDALRFEEALPLVVEVPGPQGPLPGRRTLSDIIREAVGIKV
jgi:V/A-type H+-transporting ATPase subunit F